MKRLNSWLSCTWHQTYCNLFYINMTHRISSSEQQTINHLNNISLFVAKYNEHIYVSKAAAEGIIYNTRNTKAFLLCNVFTFIVWGLCSQEHRSKQTELVATCWCFKMLFEEWNSSTDVSQGTRFYLRTKSLFIISNFSQNDGIFLVSTGCIRKCLNPKNKYEIKMDITNM